MLTKTTRLLCAMSMCLALACGDDDDDGGGNGGPADAGAAADAGLQCDPMGADPAMGGLLNAPVDEDVEVIVKTPQHPGGPGPENLP